MNSIKSIKSIKDITEKKSSRFKPARLEPSSRIQLKSRTPSTSGTVSSKTPIYFNQTIADARSQLVVGNMCVGILDKDDKQKYFAHPIPKILKPIATEMTNESGDVYKQIVSEKVGRIYSELVEYLYSKVMESVVTVENFFKSGIVANSYVVIEENILNDLDKKYITNNEIKTLSEKFIPLGLGGGSLIVPNEKIKERLKKHLKLVHANNLESLKKYKDEHYLRNFFIYLYDFYLIDDQQIITALDYDDDDETE
jgi:hypothetical protein